MKCVRLIHPSRIRFVPKRSSKRASGSSAAASGPASTVQGSRSGITYVIDTRRAEARNGSYLPQTFCRRYGERSVTLTVDNGPLSTVLDDVAETVFVGLRGWLI